MSLCVPVCSYVEKTERLISCQVPPWPLSQILILLPIFLIFRLLSTKLIEVLIMTVNGSETRCRCRDLQKETLRGRADLAILSTSLPFLVHERQRTSEGALCISMELCI